MKPEQFTQKNEFIDVPSGEKVKQKVKEKVPFHQSLEYSSLRNHPAERGSLPSALDAISVIGEMKNMEVKHVMAKKYDGTEVSMIDHFDSIMNGSASAQATYDFIENHILGKIKPVEGSITKDGAKSKDLNSLLWYKHFPEFKQIISDINEKIRTAEKHYKQAAFNESVKLGINPHSEESPYSQFKKLQSRNQAYWFDDSLDTELPENIFWNNLKLLKDKLYSEGTTRVKILARVVAEEMHAAQEFDKTHSKEEVVSEYGGYVFDGEYKKM